MSDGGYTIECRCANCENYKATDCRNGRGTCLMWGEDTTDNAVCNGWTPDSDYVRWGGLEDDD